MARTPTTHDPFNAIAEPRRRRLLELLAAREMTVGELVGSAGWRQPVVSKHLGVLKQVGLVHDRKEGRHRYYSVNREQLQPVKEWVLQMDRFWPDRLDSLERFLENTDEDE